MKRTGYFIACLILAIILVAGCTTPDRAGRDQGQNTTGPGVFSKVRTMDVTVIGKD
jgi:predicted small secreted protein